MSTGVLVVDVETTSTNPQRAHILEIGMALADLESGKVDEVGDSLVCPDCPEEEWVNCWFMEHSGLDPQAIRNAPKWEVIRPQVVSWCAVWPVTAFNRSYDVQVLYRHGVPTPMRAPCLMMACKDTLRLRGFYGDYKYPKFSEAWAYFFPDRPFEDKHRAGHDAVCEAELAVEMYRRGVLKLDIQCFRREHDDK